MPLVDFGLAMEGFYDPADPTTRYELQFEYDGTIGPTRSVNTAGQLVAVDRTGRVEPISRPAVRFAAVETALGVPPWPRWRGDKINLTTLRARIQAAGLA